MTLLAVAGCKKETAAPPPDASVAEAVKEAPPVPVEPRAEPLDAGFTLTAAQVDAWLQYRKALTAVHEKIAPKLDAIEAKSKKRDGGAMAEEGLKLIAEEAKAQEAARIKSGLSQAELDQVEALVQEMVTEREMAEDTATPEDIAEMEAVAKKLPADQKATVEQSIKDLKAQRERSANLTDMRERYGNANVEVLLLRDKELVETWTRWTQLLAGEAK